MNFMPLILAAPQRLGKSGRGTSGQQRPLLIGTMAGTLLQAPAAVARVKWHADRLERLAPLAASSCAWFGQLQAGPEQNLPLRPNPLGASTVRCGVHRRAMRSFDERDAFGCLHRGRNFR